MFKISTYNATKLTFPHHTFSKLFKLPSTNYYHFLFILNYKTVLVYNNTYPKSITESLVILLTYIKILKPL